MRIGRLFAGIALVMCVGGCLEYEHISWSPSGRYLVWVRGDNSTLGIWDTKTNQATTVKGVPDGSVAGIRYIAEDRAIVLKEQGSECVDIYERNFKKDASRKLAEGVNTLDFAISDDGAFLYYIQQSAGGTELRQRNTRKDEAAKALYTSSTDITGPVAASPSGSRILFAGKLKEEGKDEASVFYCLSTRENRVAVALRCKGSWIRWLDENTVAVLVQAPESQEDGIEVLVVHDLKTGAERRVCENVYALFNPSLNADRSKAFVTAFTREVTQTKEDSEVRSLAQVASVDLRTGERIFLTDEPLGAFFATSDPKGSRIAYMTGVNSCTLTKIMDVKTKQTKTLWVTGEEKQVADAEAAIQEGKIDTAAALYDDFLQRYPQNDLAAFANYRLMMLCLRPDTVDLDKAYSRFRRYGSNSLAERDQALFWRDCDRVSADPADDLIRTYGAEASQKDFGYNTDATRDLLGLWVRYSPTRLYVRIDLNSQQDVTGMALMDLVLLFHYDGVEGGVEQITPLAKWDRGAQRVVRFHHWYNAGDKSQYDVEILGPTGEAVSRFQASGFEDAQYPDMTFMDTSGCWTAPGSMVLSFSRKTLGLEGAKKVDVQVCTMKGGIEEFKKLERPRETPSDAGAFCDIADAFGAENTAARIDVDAKEKKTACAVIKGCAGTFEVSAEAKR